MTVETSAMYRIERALGLHAWRRMATWWALARAQRAWKVEPWRVWLTDRRWALSAAKGQAREQYRSTLRYRADKRQRESPAGQAKAELRVATGLEADARRVLLAAAREERELAWAPGWVLPGRVALAVTAAAALALIALAIVYMGSWPRWVPPTVLFVAVAAFMAAFVVATKAGADAGRHAKRADRLRRAREEYDGAWYRLRDAERAAGVEWGVTRVISPRGLPERMAQHSLCAPSDELLAVRFPARIDDEALRLREGVDGRAEAMRQRYHRDAEAGERARRTWPSHTLVVPERLTGDAVGGWGADRSG